MREKLYQIVQECGDLLLEYYRSPVSFNTKDDGSPVTQADQHSHDFLVATLPKILPYPVLSEESFISYDERKNWDIYWLIDPLDGTKGFINKCDEFCINIALIKNNKPTIGLIYAPALDEFYFAEKSKGIFYHGPVYTKKQSSQPIVALSRHHHSELTKQFLQLNNLTETATVGAALKFGRLVTGQVDLYPRFEGSKEWDIAAGQLLVEEAKGSIIDLKTKTAPVFNKQSLKNNFWGCPR